MFYFKVVKVVKVMVNGRLLCVGGLDKVLEVAPKDNPDEDTSKNPMRKKIKPKGLQSSRSFLIIYFGNLLLSVMLFLN